MLAVDRRHRILEQVAERQTIHIAELAAELGVSEMTIRRDITRLERDGFLRRTYGGATAHITRSMELLFNARALENAPAKRLIGMHAAEILAPERTLFVGIGSTTEQFAMFLPAREEVTVVTGSLPVASLLGTRKGRVVVLGGAVLTDELACVGPVAAATVRRYHADLAVLGAAGHQRAPRHHRAQRRGRRDPAADDRALRSPRDRGRRIQAGRGDDGHRRSGGAGSRH